MWTVSFKKVCQVWIRATIIVHDYLFTQTTGAKLSLNDHPTGSWVVTADFSFHMSTYQRNTKLPMRRPAGGLAYLPPHIRFMRTILWPQKTAVLRRSTHGFITLKYVFEYGTKWLKSKGIHGMIIEMPFQVTKLPHSLQKKCFNIEWPKQT